MFIEQTNKKILDRKFNEYMNRLYDDYVFENINSLTKERVKLLNPAINDQNKNKIKILTKELQDIYKKYKKEIDFLTNNFSKKNLDKEDYELLVSLKTEFDS